MSTRVLTTVVLLALIALAGCGGTGGVGGSGGEPPAGNVPVAGGTVSMGTMQVDVASTATFKTLTLNSPGSSLIAFTALYGSAIVRLQQMGYGRIAFQSDGTGNNEVCVMNADGSGLTNLTQNSADDGFPAWSPDGKHIAFNTNRDGNYEIYVMNANGGGQVNLTHHAAEDTDPAWSPDGQRIAFTTTRDGSYEVYVMNADGSGQTNLTHNAALDADPAWSPDGRRLAFGTNRDSNYEVYVMNADGSGQFNLSQNASIDEFPSWSPDGRHIAFHSARSGGSQIYVMDANGAGQTNLTHSTTADFCPSWAPDGRRIAYYSFRPNLEICAMDADGADQTDLTESGANDLNPAWCPAASVLRTLVGSAGSDGGANPPFGAQRPLAIVGLDPDGLASATTIGMTTPRWPTLQVSALQNTGSGLAGAKITGSQILYVMEDAGRGLRPRVWTLSGAPDTGAVLVFFSGQTGKVASVLGSADVALAGAATAGEVGTAQVTGSQVVLRGPFAQVYSAADPTRNLAAQPVAQVTLDSHTGEVVAAH